MKYFQNSYMDFQQDTNPHLLNGAMFAFMLLITLLITLSPFHYRLPAHFFVPTYFKWKETIENVLFFLPLGYTFLSMYGTHKRNGLFAVLLVGLLISGLIEFNQAFIPGRYPSLADLLENTLGAIIGGALHRFLQNTNSIKRLVLALEIPLANIVLLLIPLCWIDTIATGKDLNRLWLLLALLLIGGVLQVQIFLNYKLLEGKVRPARFFLFVSSWFFIAALPALLVFPIRLAVFFLAFWFLLSIWFWVQKMHIRAGGRFEQHTLKQIAPLLLGYVFLLSYWPLTVPNPGFKFVFLPDYVGVSNALTAIFRHLELLTASTLIGYIAGQVLNRSRFTLVRLSVFLMGYAILLVFIRGMHPLQRVSFTTAFLIYFCGLFGALIYQLQLHYFKWKRYQLTLGTTNSTLSNIGETDKSFSVLIK